VEKDLGAMIEGGRAVWTTTHELEKVLEYLRAQGASKNDCITVVKRLGILEQGDAKRAVHFSEAWREHRNADAVVHAQLGTLASKPDK
jgi:hypothetical protein